MRIGVLGGSGLIGSKLVPDEFRDLSRFAQRSDGFLQRADGSVGVRGIRERLGDPEGAARQAIGDATFEHRPGGTGKVGR